MSKRPETDGKEMAPRDHQGRFLPGTTPNPKGRPRGARNRSTLAAQALLDGEAEALTRKAIEAALAGDIAALKLCLDRVLPLRKGRPVQFDIGELERAADLSAASRRLLEAVGAGELSPEEAQAVGVVIETARRALETEELEMRISALEDRA